MPTTPLMDQVTFASMPSKDSRPPAGMLTLMGNVFLKPGNMCSLPLALGLAECSAALSQYSRSTLRLRRSSYTNFLRLFLSMHRSSALTSVASNSSSHDTVTAPFKSSPNSKVLLGTVNETAAFGFLNLLKKPIDHHLCRSDHYFEELYPYL